MKTNERDKTLIGLDVGAVRVGVAVAEPGKLPAPCGTYPRAQGSAEKVIIELINNRQAGLLVVGLPLDRKDRRTAQCDSVERFVRRLQRRVQIAVVYIDEHLSSEDAKERLGIRGEPDQKLRESGAIDAAAAAIILETYLAGCSG